MSLHSSRKYKLEKRLLTTLIYITAKENDLQHARILELTPKSEFSTPWQKKSHLLAKAQSMQAYPFRKAVSCQSASLFAHNFCSGKSKLDKLAYCVAGLEKIIIIENYLHI